MFGPGPSPIDLGNPVADHPLNAGLVAWYLPLPNNSGGSRLFDLKGGNHGTLTNGPTWVPGPNGFGALAINPASSQYVNVGQVDMGISTAMTVAVWVRTSNLGPDWYRTVVAKGEGAAFRLARDGGSSNLGFVAGSGSVVGSNAVNDGRWHLAVGTADPGAVRLYFDGRLDGSSGGAGSISWPATDLLIGDNPQATGRCWPGDIGDVSIWRRALSATEVAVLYDQARRGHPDTLRRFTPRVWSFGTAGGGGGAPTLDQFGYRFYADDGSESASTALAAQNTAVSRAKNTPTRLRIGVNRTN